MEVLVARQPIFDRQRKLYGYELLFRSNPALNEFDGTEAAAATMQVLSNTLMAIGSENLLGGKKAFVNFDNHLLESGMYMTLPRESIVIEILETVKLTDALVELCQKIKQQGYSLALDDFTSESGCEPLTCIADLIKVDLRLTAPKEQKRMLDTYQPRGICMLAEKVETYEEFESARRAGYDLFQGYFFARPALVRSQQIPTVKTACLRLLREVQQPEMDFGRIQDAIREDVSLTYQLLRYVNSAVFPQRGHIESITRALLVIGDVGIRRWASLATLPMLATDKPSELVTLSLVRAHFCERLAELAHVGPPGDAFLMGMFSLLDALVDKPLDEALQSIDMRKNLVEALLGKATGDSFLSCVCQLINHYERGNWDEVERLSRECGIPTATIGQTYLDSTAWVASLTS